MGLLEKKEVTDVTAVVVVPDNEVEHVDTSLSFENHVARFQGIIANNRKRSLKTIWEMGAFINVLKKDSVYGGKTVETFIESMKEDAVSRSEIYKYAQFAERYSVAQVNKLLLSSGASWQVAVNLMRIKDVEARTLLEERIDKGEIAPSRLQGFVSELNAKLNNSAEEESEQDKTGKANRKPQVNNCRASFKKVVNYLENVLQIEDSCAKDITDLSAILDNESLYERAVDSMEEFKGLLPRVRETLDNIEKMLDKTI